MVTDGKGGIWNIAFPLSTSPGQRPEESEGRLINAYAEPLGENAGVIYHRAPGVIAYGADTNPVWTWWTPFEECFNPQQVPLSTIGLFRGGIFVNNVLYAVFGTNLYTIVQGGAATQIAVVSGTDKVFFARNNDSPIPDIVLVFSGGAFLVSQTGITPYPSIDVGSPNCVVGSGGYIIFGYGDGAMLSTDINSTNINSLSTATAESNPDGIVQLVDYGGQLYVFGNATVEIWGLPKIGRAHV
jgi:hypothetical protein